MRTIVITNMKGGVSKTTTALSLAKGMADKGYKTLLIDSDPQANATDVAGNIGNELDEKFINEFNDDIVSLVLGATEEDKSLSWEERKTITIDKVKYLDLRHKAVVCADKISKLLLDHIKNKKLRFNTFCIVTW